VDLASLGAYTDLGQTPPTAGFDHPQVVNYIQGDPGLYRIDSRTDVWGVWQPDLALEAGLYDVSGVDNPLVVADVARYWDGIGGRSSQLYDLLGVRYVLGSKQVVLDWNKFSLVFDGDPSVDVYRNKTALPRAFVVHRAIAAATHKDAWTLIHQPEFEPGTTVVVEGGQSLDSRPAGGESGTAQVVAYGLNSVEIDVNTPAEGYLFLSDPFYPGWQARVDGEPAPILRADYAFRAVAVPAGSHRVTIEFRPGSWYAGLGISGATVLVLLVLGSSSLARRRRAQQRTE
jgi:hypothetical protein